MALQSPIGGGGEGLRTPKFNPPEWQDGSWRDAALCNDKIGSMAVLFFSSDLDDIAAAKAVCQECSVQQDCLEFAINHHEPWGVWGGELFADGKIADPKKQPGRPLASKLSIN